MKYKKTRMMKHIEELTDTDIRDYLIELYVNKDMRHVDMVQHFKEELDIEITFSTFSQWFSKLQIPTREYKL